MVVTDSQFKDPEQGGQYVLRMRIFNKYSGSLSLASHVLARETELDKSNYEFIS